MYFFKQVFFMFCVVIIMSACSQINRTKSIDIPNIKKEKEIKKTKSKIKNKEHKDCKKYSNIMTHASSYIQTEFNEAYFLQKDIVGAKAQIFLIKSKSPSVFAKNINNANSSYLEEYKLAKNHGCNLKKFKKDPLVKILNTINILKKNLEKNKDYKNESR